MPQDDKRADAPPSSDSIAWRLQDLRETLASARDLYRKGAIDKRRRAAELALNAVIEFIDPYRSDDSAGLAEPLIELATALFDIRRSKRHELVAVKPLRHRPPDSMEAMWLKSVAAGCMELFMRSGKSRSAAASMVARKLSLAGITKLGGGGRSRIGIAKPGGGGRSRIDAGTVKAWRDALTGPGDPDNPSFARQRFRWLLAECEANKTEHGCGLDTQAEMLLTLFPTQFPNNSKKGRT